MLALTKMENLDKHTATGKYREIFRPLHQFRTSTENLKSYVCNHALGIHKCVLPFQVSNTDVLSHFGCYLTVPT